LGGGKVFVLIGLILGLLSDGGLGAASFENWGGT
jgi:hypothetical protein